MSPTSAVQPIHPAGRPALKGPYIHGVKVSDVDLVFTSGLTSRDHTGEIVGETVEEQTRQVIANLTAVLAEVGADMSNVIRMTVYITKNEDYDGMNRVRSELLSDVSFTSTTLVTGLHISEALVEIDIVAAIPR